MTTTPLTDTLHAAREAYDASDTHDEALYAALDAARDALADSDEPRDWILREAGYDYATEVHGSLDDALESARDGVDRANYSEAEGTLYIGVSVRCELTGETESGKVTLEPDAPDCTDDRAEHAWESPKWLGGLAENPGCWGHGGGVICTEVCMHCGCSRTTDTWAQDPETGEQGLTSVEYETERYADDCERERRSRRSATVTLGRDGMGEHADEADYDAWVAYVCARIDDATGRDVSVDSRGMDDVQGTTIEGDDAQQIRDALTALWDDFCGDDTAWPSRDAQQAVQS